jgi:hypothetical protein
MGDERLTRATSVLIAWVACVILAVAAFAQPSYATGDQESEQGADPTALEVPHLGELGLSVNAAWTLQECPQLSALPWVAVVCSPEGEVVLFALGYDPAAGPWPLTLSVLDSLGQPRELDYTVTLAAPEPPTVVAGSLPLVGIAGGRTLVPISALVTECVQCARGVVVSATVVVDPNAFPVPPAARVWMAGNHLVIDAPVDATEVTVALMVADDSGMWGAPSEFTLPVRILNDQTAVPLHRTATVPSGQTLEVALADLLLTESLETWFVDRCGTAVVGTVLCDESTVRYDAGEGSALADQFWVILRSDQGDVAMASLTIATGNAAGTSDATLGWAPAAASTAASAIAIASPEPRSADSDASDPGALAPLWSLLPRLTIEPPPTEESTP